MSKLVLDLHMEIGRNYLFEIRTIQWHSRVSRNTRAPLIESKDDVCRCGKCNVQNERDTTWSRQSDIDQARSFPEDEVLRRRPPFRAVSPQRRNN